MFWFYLKLTLTLFIIINLLNNNVASCFKNLVKKQSTVHTFFVTVVTQKKKIIPLTFYIFRSNVVVFFVGLYLLYQVLQPAAVAFE